MARLHKGERILTPEENQTYNGKGGNAYQIHVNVHGQLTDKGTIDKMLDAMVTRIQAAGGAGA
jgi:predicted heme/steroid binding protein